MTGNYEKWVESETNWINEMEKQQKKEARIASLLAPVAMAVIFGFFGLISGGGIRGILQNMVFSLPIGIIAMLFCFLLSRPSYPKKMFLKAMKTEIEDVLSAEGKENFASQMLGLNGEVKCVSWQGNVWKGKREGKVRITDDYILKTSADGTLTLVERYRVKEMKTDDQESSITTRGGGVRMTQTSVEYLICFYYQNSANGAKGKYDKVFGFQEREIREEVTLCIKGIPL